MEFPQVYRNDEGVELIAENEIQAAAFERGGFDPVGNTEKKRTPRQQQ